MMTIRLPSGQHDQSSPIAGWLRALRAPDELSAFAALREVYRGHSPTQVEIIFTGACPFTCQHCIYPPTYARDNKNIEDERWLKALIGIYENMGIDTFVYSGRSVEAEGVRLLLKLRRHIPDVKIGLIDNAISSRPHLDSLKEVSLDWVDISLDGMPEHHDRQRGCPGSFAKGLSGLYQIRRQKLAPKISILTCLTNINRCSVPEMIRWLNNRGFHNFFITPVVIVPGVRPDMSLAVESADLLRFVGELDDLIEKLDDAYVELGLFEPECFAPFAIIADCEFSAQRDHLLRRVAVGDSEFCVRYFPGSLVGTRELVVNTDGSVIQPKAMVFSKISDNLKSASILKDGIGRDTHALESPMFSQHFAQELQRERSLLGQRQKLESQGGLL